MSKDSENITAIIATLSKLTANLENIKVNQADAFKSFRKDIDDLQKFQHEFEVKEGMVKGAAWGIRIAAIVIQAMISASVFVLIKLWGLI